MTEEDFPSYKDKGYLEIEILYICPFSKWLRYEVEEIEADLSSSVYWIQEGIGVEYWVNNYLDLELPGKYHIEGIHGHYHRGDWSAGEDDDEEWYFDRVIRID